MNRTNAETLALMDATRAARGLSSDYQLARLLGAQTSYTSAWRKGRHMSDEYAERCAELAGLDPVETVLRVAAERESGTTQKILRSALARITSASASVLLVLLLGVGTFSGAKTAAAAELRQVSSVSAPSHVIYYVKLIMRAWLRDLLRQLTEPRAWCLA